MISWRRLQGVSRTMALVFAAYALIYQYSYVWSLQGFEGRRMASSTIHPQTFGDSLDVAYDDISLIRDLFSLCPLVHIGISHPALLCDGIFSTAEQAHLHGLLGTSIAVGTQVVPLPIVWPEFDTDIFSEDVITLPGATVNTEDFWVAVCSAACGALAQDNAHAHSPLSRSLQRVDLILGLLLESNHLRVHCTRQENGDWNAAVNFWRMGDEESAGCHCVSQWVPLIQRCPDAHPLQL